METTKGNRAILNAASKGYTIDDNGQVWYKNKKVNGDEVSARGYHFKRFGVRLDDGEKYAVKHHRFQAYRLYGNTMFISGIQVRHLDGNSLNNTKSNILIGTQSKNMMDISKRERIIRGKHAASFLIKHDAKSIKKDHKDGYSYVDLMVKYDISSKGTVSYIINKR